MERDPDSDPDPDPDPVIFIINLQDANKKEFFKEVFLHITLLHHFFTDKK